MDGLSGTHVQPVATWTFFHWGHHGLVELLPTLGVDEQRYVEEQFWTAARWQELQAMEEPEPPPVLLPAEPVLDGRTAQLREPFPRCYADQMAFLKPCTERYIIDAPTIHAVPAVQAPDGTVHFYFLHMFAGRRRVGDCHHWLEECFHEHFPQPNYVAHVISIDAAISAQLCNVFSFGAF